jgi:hypothetical protein
MEDNQRPIKKSIARDEFTQRLINIQVELVKLGAIAKKKEFSNALGVTSIFWNHIEARRNNFPKDEMKRFFVAKSLQDTFKVRMEYLLTGTGTLFIEPPQKRVDAYGERAAGINFRDKAEKRKVLTELEDYKTQLEACKARVAELEAEIAAMKAG